jgi:glutamate racemase
VTAEAPIGVFDSGVGGLTVVRELLWRLPAESLLYIADTAHVPYGDRSPDEIRGYGVALTRYLANRGCKLVVMACNTSSALALDEAAAAVDVPVLGTIEGGARAAAAVANGGCLGVLATAATVASGAYPRAIAAAARTRVEVRQVACPRFVPLVEAGRVGTPDSYDAVGQYLGQLPLLELDALVLGCTHYPFLAPVIRSRVEERTYLVDPAVETAKQIEADLAARGLLARGPARHELRATGDLESLRRTNQLSFGGRLPELTKLTIEG